MTPTSILTLDSVAFTLPDGRQLFSELNERFDQRRTGLVGRNGVGKTVLAQILAGRLLPTAGTCRAVGRVHYLAQHLATPNTTVAQLAQVGEVLDALQRIEAGSSEQHDFDTVGERWDMRERLQAQLARHGLEQLDAQRRVATLSGGQSMRVGLLGAFLSNADFLILDEPSNHLDTASRALLFELIAQWRKGLLLISHDRELLAHMQRIVELSTLGLSSYGGNYSVYAQCKAEESAQAEHTLERLKLERRQQARELQQQRERLERHQSRARRDARDTNQAKILLDRKQQRSEITAAKQQRHHQAARQATSLKVREATRHVEENSAIVLHAPAPVRPTGSPLVCLRELQLPFAEHAQPPLNWTLYSGERIALTGANGSGKSTLLKMIAGQLRPREGQCDVHGNFAYLDQQCSQLPAAQSVLGYLRECTHRLDESALRTRLAQLGLDAQRLDMPSGLLSGGERLKAMLARVLYGDTPVQLLLLDEPGNHLDLPSLAALEAMLLQYCGALLLASHDRVLLRQLNMDGELHLGS